MTIDVERYYREGYLIQDSVIAAGELEKYRLEANRLLKLCTDQSERYARSIEWEVDHLAKGEQAFIKRLSWKNRLPQVLGQLVRPLPGRDARDGTAVPGIQG